MKKDVSKIIEELKKLQKDPDTETAHLVADWTLCKLLDDLGYEDVTKEWNKVHKWYA